MPIPAEYAATHVLPPLHCTHEDVPAGGVRLHLVRAGEGAPVLLLHGFPDFWFSWRYQIPALAAAGFEVFAPDMRGYNTSDKPPGVASYDIDVLVDDVVALAGRCGGKVFLAGHDWGGIVAWHAAMRRPDCFEKLVVLNAPHPAAYARDLWRTGQWLASWYAFFFQLPVLPETLLRMRNFRALDETFSREVRAEAFAHGEVELYKQAHSQPGALASMVHYYRAAVRRAVRRREVEQTTITIPTLLLWGERDRHLRASLTEGLEPWVPQLTVQRMTGAGHWLHLDEPDRVSRAMIGFFSS